MLKAYQVNYQRPGSTRSCKMIMKADSVPQAVVENRVGKCARVIADEIPLCKVSVSELSVEELLLIIKEGVKQ